MGSEVERPESEPAALPAPSDEPSAQWGWHGGFPRGSVIAGWIAAATMLLMLIGHSEGLIPDIYLSAIAIAMIGLLIRHQLRSRHPWRR